MNACLQVKEYLKVKSGIKITSLAIYSIQNILANHKLPTGKEMERFSCKFYS